MSGHQLDRAYTQYSSSLRQQAQWIEDAIAGRGPVFEFSDIDLAEIRKAADHIDDLENKLNEFQIKATK